MKHVSVLILCMLSISVFGQVSELQALIVDASLTNNADSVLRDEKVTINIPDRRTMIYDNQRTITVYNKAGMNDVDAIVYYDEVTKVKMCEALIYDKFGAEIKKFKKKDFKDVSAVSGGTLFSDSRILYMDYVPTSFPYTVVFHSVTETSNTAFIPKWFPNSSYKSSTAKSQFAINYEPSLNLRHKLLNPSDQVKIEESTGRVKISIENFEAIVYEPHSPDFLNIVPQVIFAIDSFHLEGVDGTAKDWESFGKWMDDYLLKGTRELSTATKSEIKSLVQGVTDPIEKARLVYQYVQNKTRYISVQVGIGGWKPMLAKEVDELGYGDCKALTNYTKALLEEVDVPSYYTVLYAGDAERDIEADFTSIQGNHAILAIPHDEDYVWLECTSQEIPFGFIGNFTDNRDVLVITPEGGRIVHTKTYETQGNQLNGKTTFSLNEKGGIIVQYKGEAKGMQYDDRFDQRLSSKTEKELADYYMDYWSYVNGASMTTMLLENNKEEVVYNESTSFEADNYATFVGDEMLFVPNAINRSTYIPKRSRNRKRDLRLKVGFVDTDEIMITIPEGMSPKFIPPPVHLESKFGFYEAEIEQLDTRTLKYVRTFMRKEDTFPKESYKEFRSFMKKVARHDNSKIILTKS